mmetsp:Transcript_160/g.425  ORF Transcript_160/g.425 Transcript_160/m.425 type:complete len:100 (-) Transcript_160:45-344(-)
MTRRRPRAHECAALLVSLASLSSRSSRAVSFALSLHLSLVRVEGPLERALERDCAGTSVYVCVCVCVCLSAVVRVPLSSLLSRREVLGMRAPAASEFGL